MSRFSDKAGTVIRTGQRRKHPVFGGELVVLCCMPNRGVSGEYEVLNHALQKRHIVSCTTLQETELVSGPRIELDEMIAIALIAAHSPPAGADAVAWARMVVVLHDEMVNAPANRSAAHLSLMLRDYHAAVGAYVTAIGPPRMSLPEPSTMETVEALGGYEGAWQMLCAAVEDPTEPDDPATKEARKALTSAKRRGNLRPAP